MIELRQVAKTFRIHRKAPGLKASIKSLFWREHHEVHALKATDLRVEQGEIIGLLGANGAGKTTLVKLCTGIVFPSQGQVRVLHMDPWQRSIEFRRNIALIMGQKAQLWWDLSAADSFLLLRDIYQIDDQDFRRRVDELSAMLDVRAQLNTQIRRLSLGERMKMELMASLLHRPQVLFLDEPTIGLDITSQRNVRRFLQDYHAEYRPTLVLTSHYMEDIESLCDRVVVVREGEKIYDGRLKELVERYASHKTLSIRFHSEDEALNLERTVKDLQFGGESWRQDDHLCLTMAKSDAAHFTSRLLQRASIDDFKLEDADIATMIANIQKHGFQAHR